jgi:hypothetical protein
MPNIRRDMAFVSCIWSGTNVSRYLWATGVSKVLEEPSLSSYRVLPQSTCLKAEVQVSKTQGTGLRRDLTMWPCWPYLRSCTLSFAAGSWAVLHALIGRCADVLLANLLYLEPT